MKNNRAAGEREGARPASHFNDPPQKRLEREELVKKVSEDFFDKLKQGDRLLPVSLLAV